jgi:hypothetical protein
LLLALLLGAPVETDDPRHASKHREPDYDPAGPHGGRADVRTSCGRRVLLVSTLPAWRILPAAPLPRVTFIPAINGKSAAPRKDGHAPSYRVRPGERLIMRVTVTVPSHLTLTALWFGISTGIVGGGSNGTGSMHPILAHYRQPLSTGSHTFGLRWRVPKRRSGTSLYLVTSWSSRHPPANVGQFVAQLILS